MNTRDITADEQALLAKMLYRIGFFSNFKRDDFDRMARSWEVRSFQKGDVLLAQGAPNDTFYFLLSGTLEVKQKRMGILNKVLGKIEKKGEFFGEMSLLDGRKAMASVVAATSVDVFALSSGRFGDLFEKNVSFKEGLAKIASARSMANHGKTRK